MDLSEYYRYIKLIKQLPVRTLIHLASNYPCYIYKRALGIRYIEKKVNNYRMLLDLKDQGISKELMLYGTREQEHSLMLQRELSEGMTVLDIGANVGYYSIMMGQLVGRNGKVYAVEPSLSNYYMLNLNIRLNDLTDVVELFNVGISNRTGTGNFYQSEKSNWHTFYPKIHKGQTHESLVGETPIRVPTITLEDFSIGKRKLEMIRMDIEGYEVEVLESIHPLLVDNYFSPKILFEVHQPRYDDIEHNMRQCLENIFDAGYYVKMLASNMHQAGGANIFACKGYTPEQVLKTDNTQRGIFNTISNDDAIWFICDTDYVRTVLLVRK